MKFPYLYETHLHTKEGSACSRSTAKELVQAYKAAGYTGIMVTDHFYRGNTAIDRNCSWEDWVEAYCKGYENAREEGEKMGLQVFFGWEESYQGTDFLIYGLDKEWLKKHPELKEISIEEQYELVHKEGGMVIQAHPYREAGYIPEIRLFPQAIDGVEVKNASHYGRAPEEDGRSSYDAKALRFADKYQLPYTGGSDIHNSEKLLYGGMEFSRKLTDVQDYIKAVLAREGRPVDYFMIRKEQEKNNER
ncbi:MAG: PHP domain-containing protein [Lachnospiraceae bacterium]|nr:PHP domain-containing protein [Lachnospiraceae bacterium]